MKKYDVDNGVLIAKVENFGKASNARLFKGLVIVEADREKVDNISDLKEKIEDKKGKAILLNVVDSKGTNRFVGLEIPE